MKTDWDVIVIGGGLAGLVAGATAASAGVSAVVLEGHQPGGRARVTVRDAYTFNHGGHALYVAGPGTAILRALGVTPEGAPPPLERYRALRDGQQHLLPTGPGTLLRTTVMGRRAKAGFARLLGTLPVLKPAKLAGASAGSWLAERELRPEADAVVRALIRISTYTADLDQLGADAAVTQLQLAARSGVLYLHGGWAQLIDGLAARVEVRPGTEVLRVEPAAGRVEVHTAAGPLLARQVVVATGTPAAARAVLPAEPGWADLGEPVTAACLDVGVNRVPQPGYVLGVDDPLYGTTQSPPARQAPPGHAVVAVIRYGARTAEQDRPQLERHLGEVGVKPADIVTRRFLARMVVAGASPRPERGGLAGRPSATAAVLPGIRVAGDWVGPEGLLADAAIASGRAAAVAALSELDRAPVPA